jgi:Heavy metal binding domain
MRFCCLLLVLALATAPAAQRAQAGGQGQKLPPLSYVCPMAGDEDVIEDAPGLCRKCRMELKPIRLDSAWTCPVHAAVVKESPGKCPLDRRDLVQVTVAVSWTCPGTDLDVLSPAACADGSPMAKKFTPRAHGNHNPQHGGLFFMAPDNWHHLEGTYPQDGVFRLYLYDDFTKPLSRDQMQKAVGRLVLKETFDPETKTTREITAVPLKAVRNGRYLEAKIAKVPFPAQMTAKLKFQPAAPEHRFDFTFPEYSKEPVAPRMTDAAPASPAPPTRVGAELARPDAGPAPPDAGPARPDTPATVSPAAPVTASPSAAPAAPAVDPGLIPLPIPDTVPEILAQLAQRTEQVRRFIDQGTFASVYVPAFQAKDLALALDERKNDLEADGRRTIEPAIKRLVRSAWLLDAFGDLGNKQQIVLAFAQFEAAVKDVQTAFPAKQ